MIGVNVWTENPADLKEVMTLEKINWRSFVHQDTITQRWNLPSTPSFYIIDHKGVIRRKWTGNPGEKTLDDALEKLIQEAEEAAPPK